MIVVELTYGLANQMFQYAAAKALSLRNQQVIKVDVSFFAKGQDDKRSHELYGLDIFAGLENIVAMPIEELKLLRQQYEQQFLHKNTNRIRKFVGLTPAYNYAWEKEFLKFDPTILRQQAKIIYLTGYFQNESYFAEYAQVICNDFRFKSDSISLENQELGQQMTSEESVAVHVRRGDYVGNRYVAPVAYYDEAIAYIAKQCKKPVFYLFSDDPDWTRKHIKVSDEHYYLSHNTGAQSYQDMYLMSQCRHNIIANSSFSWWGAWLNGNEKKIVIAPEKWLPEKGIVSKDIVPPSWVII